MDEIDWRLLKELQQDCRISYRELAKRVGLSTTAAMSRVAAMQDDGTIMEFGVAPSNTMIDAEHYIVLIHTDTSENIEELIDEIGALPETIIVGELVTTKGRSYVATGQYVGSARLQEIGRILRKLPGVEEVELHPVRRILVSDGTKMVLTRHHLLVLKALTTDARMPINRIAEETGLTRKRVRKILQNFKDTGAFRFGTRANFTKKRRTELVIKTHYDDYDSSLRTFDEWCQNTERTELFDVFYSITEPIAFAWFMVKDIRDVDRVSKAFAKEPFVVSSTPLVLQSMWKFPWLSELKMDEMLSELDD
ncbi:MAG: AsnC family transcriptional regulator [Candidatus Thorarchaeota archaeon]